MKSFITAIIIAAILFSGSIIYTKKLYSESQKLLDITHQIYDSLNNDDYIGAKDSIDELHDMVSDFESFFLATGNHIEIDNIKMNLSELRSFAEGGMKSDALAKTYVLQFLLEHLPESMRLSIENIL